MRLPQDKRVLRLLGKEMHQVQVYLDGELISAVVEVDDEEGWVKRLVSHDRDGQHHEVLEGSVEIKYHHDPIDTMKIRVGKKQRLEDGEIVYVAFVDLPSPVRPKQVFISEEKETRREAVTQLFDIMEAHDGH